jgi:hypothetical protein
MHGDLARLLKLRNRAAISSITDGPLLANFMHEDLTSSREIEDRRD